MYGFVEAWKLYKEVHRHQIEENSESHRQTQTQTHDARIYTLTRSYFLGAFSWHRKKVRSKLRTARKSIHNKAKTLTLKTQSFQLQLCVQIWRKISLMKLMLWVHHVWSLLFMIPPPPLLLILSIPAKKTKVCCTCFFIQFWQSRRPKHSLKTRSFLLQFCGFEDNLSHQIDALSSSCLIIHDWVLMIPPPSLAAAPMLLAFYFGSKNANVLHFLLLGHLIRL